ncbi:receptor-type tyrosine-protein phosphatase eta-like [Xenentodon cancila]
MVRWTNETNDQSTNVTETNHNVTELTPGGRYSFTVITVAGDNETRSDAAETSHYTRPGTIGSLQFSTNTTSISLNWTSPPGQVFMYKVVWNEAGGSQLLSVFTNKTSSVLSNLIPGTLYNIGITVVAGDNQTEGDSYTANDTTIPAVVGNLSVNSVTTSSVVLTWITTAGKADSYKIKWNSGESSLTSIVTNKTFTIDKLVPGVLYNITVTAVKTKEGEAAFISTYTKPENPANITVTGRGTDSLNISWTLTKGRVDNYVVNISNDDLMYWKPYKTSVSMASLTGLRPGRLYVITVNSVAGAFENSSTTSLATVPTSPSSINISARTNASLQVEWKTPDRMDGAPNISYSITYKSRDVPGNVYITVIGGTTTLDVSWTKAVGTVSSYTVLLYTGTVLVENKTALSNETEHTQFVDKIPGVLYCVKVVTVSGSVECTSERTCNATFPTPPGPITVDYQTVSSINFTWSLPEGMNHSQYNFSVSNTSESYMTENNWWEFRNLKSGSPYRIFVNTVGVLGYESTNVSREKYTRPYSVSNLNQTEVSTSSVTLVWEQPDRKPSYSYMVKVIAPTPLEPAIVNEMIKTVDGLQSGCNVSFTVTTLTADGTEAEPVTVSYFTRPYNITELQAITLNATAIDLKWMKPVGYKDYYQYLVQIVDNDTEFLTVLENRTMSGLTPGTNYTFCVTVIAAKDAEGEKRCISQYTKPERGQPSVSNEHSNSSVVVSWTKPPGNVECYILHLNSTSTGYTKVKQLNASSTSFTFSNLSAGVLYTILLATCSGPFNASSEFVTIATCPNPPGPIEILKKTSSSIELKWEEAPLMTGASFHYVLNYTLPDKISQQQDISISIPSANTSYILSPLDSGTPYTITLKTVGPMNFESDIVRSGNVTTRPLSVTFLNSAPKETSINVTWSKPHDHKETYRYNLTWQGLDQNSTITLQEPVHVIDDLKPGSAYNISVTTETSDGTQSDSKWINICTNADPVTDLHCYGPNLTDAELRLSWTKPAGQSYGFKIIMSAGTGLNVTSAQCCNHNVSGLKYYTDYDVNVTTQSCGQPSTPVSKTCRTGITLKDTHSTSRSSEEILTFVIGDGSTWKGYTNGGLKASTTYRSAAVRVEDYDAYYRKQKADSNCGFAEEFEDLKVVGTGQSKIHALTVENKPKNRYNNVLPYDSSRVKLSIVHGSQYDDYINANYMPGYLSRKEFIAAQGPLPTTVNEFWRMIWEKNVQTLVMLTRCLEQGRIKCEQYWDSGTKHFDEITVTTTSEIPLDDWTIRDFHIKNVRTAEVRSVRHFHFTAWPDHGVPETTELLISFRHLVREHMNQYSRHSPTVVHCSAGVGRTGTFIAIDRLIFQIERENIVDVYGIVYDLRMHRPLMVQTEDQYVFLNQCALDVIRSRTGNNVDLIYQNTAALSIYENVQPKKRVA